MRIDFTMFIHFISYRVLVCILGVWWNASMTYFPLVWIPMSTKLWDFTCLLIFNMFGSLVVFLTHFVPLVVDHALFMYCTLVLDAHTLSPLSCHVLIHAFVSVWSSSIYNMSFYLCLCSLNLVFRVFSFFFWVLTWI